MADIELALLFDRFMRKIHFALQAKAHEFDREDVGPLGGIVLLTLEELGCVRMQDLTDRMARDKSQMTRTIRSLETKGLVKRDASSMDARVSMVSLTQEGDGVVEDLKHVLGETIDELLARLDEPEKQMLKGLLNNALG
ncbi:MAG: MarR family transcriptional regulator [Pseudomonadota bacterium]